MSRATLGTGVEGRGRVLWKGEDLRWRRRKSEGDEERQRLKPRRQIVTSLLGYHSYHSTTVPALDVCNDNSTRAKINVTSKTHQ